MESGTLDLTAAIGPQVSCPRAVEEAESAAPDHPVGDHAVPMRTNSSGSSQCAQSGVLGASATAANTKPGVVVDASLLLRRTAELANAAVSLGDGVQAVQSYLAQALGWTALGYRICGRDPIGPVVRDASNVAPPSSRGPDGSLPRPVVVRVQEGGRLAATLSFQSHPRQVSKEQRALLAQVARQLAVLAQRDLCRRGMLTGEFEILHQGQLAGMAEVAQGLSHELSQPLAALTAYAGALRRLLDRGSADSAEIAYLGERLLQQVDRAGGILQATKSFILQRTCATGSVDVEAAVRQLITFARRELRAASVDLRLEVAAGLPPARGSEPHLAQIILSLLANAMAALEPVAVERRRITIRILRAEHEVRIGVIDGGRHNGADAAAGSWPFYAAYSDGAQIGLAISRSLAEIQGGRLWMEQAEGETAFVVALPVIH